MIADLEEVRLHDPVFEQMGLHRHAKVERRMIANLDEVEFREQRRFEKHPSADLAAHESQAGCHEGRSINGFIAVAAVLS